MLVLIFILTTLNMQEGEHVDDEVDVSEDVVDDVDCCVDRSLCVQEEDHDDPLCLDQRTIGHLDGPQVHWDHVKGFSRDKTVKASETI